MALFPLTLTTLNNSISVTSRHCLKTAEQTKLIVGTKASFGLAYTVLEGNSGISKNKGTSH